MSFNFNREQIKKWTKLDDHYYIDYQTEIGINSSQNLYRGYSTQKDCLITIKITNNETNEIKTLENMSELSHEYIMKYYGQLTKNNQNYLFLQYCPKGNLKSHIKKGLTQTQVLRLFRQLIEGMTYINAKKKMHRDLKPEYIMLGFQQDIKISNFGYSGQLSNIFTSGQKGTPIYSAPQIFMSSKNQKFSQTCDVWSAGLILYEMLIGEHFFTKIQNIQQLRQQWLKCNRALKKTNLPEKYHPIWNCLVNWMLDFDYKRRPTFSQIITKLKQIYPQLQNQLETGNFVLQPSLQRLENYFQFNIKKYQVILDLCQIFTIQDFNLRNQFKFAIMFCGLMRYVSYFRTFLLSLNFQRIQVNYQPLLTQTLAKHPYTSLFIAKTKTCIEQKYDFYHQQIKSAVIPKILNVYCKRQQSQVILHDFKKIIEEVKSISKGETAKPEQFYQQLLKSILFIIEKHYQDVTKYYHLPQLKIYYKILLAMLISEKYPLEKYMQKDIFQEQNAAARQWSKVQLIQQINLLKNEVF